MDYNLNILSTWLLIRMGSQQGKQFVQAMELR